MSVNKTNDIKKMHSRLQDNPIAIIGISAIFPESKNLQEYWDNIVKEVDCINDVPPSRWNIDDYYDPDPNAEDKTYCKRGGFIPDVDFDPMEFGLPPNILEVTDVNQLLSLLLAKEVLKDGGYEDASDQLKENTGVILGVGGGQKLVIPLAARLQYPIWKRVLKSSGLSDADCDKIVEKIKKAYVGWEENSFPGTLGNVIAGRIANRLNLGGTNCVVDAACASSLSGIRMAVSELLEYRAEMMITGGVDTDNSPYMYMCFSKTQAFSKGEKSSPFDAGSDGMLMGEGIGMILLKRLVDAERDNDRIYAIIRGIGSSSDGKFKSIYAPRAKGQELALMRAYNDAGISPSSVDMIEAHGTGTTAGDMEEVKALKNFYQQHDTQKQHIALGSVKSQIGHIKNAAGSAGIIKTALSLYHKIIPATINIKKPNKDLDLENSSFFLNTSVRPWFRAENEPPRRAGLSAFGFGGTNFHFILEEYTPEPTGRYRLHRSVQPFVFSAPTPEKLIEVCQEALAGLQSEQAEIEFLKLAEQSKTKKIPQESARIGFVADSVTETINTLEEAITQLKDKIDQDSWSSRKGIHYRKSGMDHKGKVVALFAGQGSPYLNMGKELINNFPPMMRNHGYMDKLFIEDGLPPLSQVVYPPTVFDKNVKKEQEKRLQLTENAQPAIGVFSAGQFQLLQDAGFKPDYTAGHSFGELTALWAAGVFSDDDYFTLAKARGKAMAAPDDPNFDAGSMLAVMGNIENLQDDLKEFEDTTIANFNSRSQVVIAGPKDEIIKVQKHLKTKDYRTVLLGVSAAFHTKLVGHAQKPFAEVVNSVKFNKPTCKVYSNASAKPYAVTPKNIQKTLQEHILNSVLFKQEIENIYNDGGRVFVEFGPQSILTRLVENILQDKSFVSVALNANAKKNSDRQFRDAIVKLKVVGMELGDFDQFEYRPEITEKKKTALTLKLSGTNYVSEKTRQAFEEALNDGHQIQTAIPASTPIVATNKLEKEMKQSKKGIEKQDTAEQPTVDLNFAMESLERGLANFYNHQNETLRIHEQFLNNQLEYSRSFFQIMQQQAQLGPASMPNEVAQSITQFHNHQGETLRIHEQYLKHQTEYSKNSFELIRQQQGILINRQPLYSTSLHHISTQPQSYTVPKLPEMPRQLPVEPAPQSVAAPITMPPVQPQPSLPPQNTDINNDILTKTLLDVVAERTGYQSDMLELNMDMEADLGIDSIKRVEILNGIQEKMPNLPQVNPEELAELRTLEQIINHLMPQSGTNAATTVEASKLASPEPSHTLDKNRIVKAFLDVVSEKTGYQADMLELDMDMEADLGIDSIKRVEILNGIQEKLPDLPEINPEDLAELRTLGQITDYMTSSEEGKSKPTIDATPSKQINDVPEHNDSPNIQVLTQTLLEVVSEKTGYMSDMLELNMDMEADLGIDSIKRVEILNGMQEKLPTLPEVNPEDLAELRTLEQIVTKMGQAANATGTTTSTAIKKKVIPNTVSSAR